MKDLLIAGAALVALGTPACAREAHQEAQGRDDAAKVSFGLTGATDYVWRGVSQTDSDPAVFASVNLAYRGFYAGAGTENVRFAGIRQEYDLWAGYGLDLGAVRLDSGVVRYGYVDSAARIDTLEGKLALSGKVGKLGLTASGYYTGNYFGSGNGALYTEAAAAFPATARLSLSGAYGHQQIDRAQGYDTWNLGASYAVLPGASLGLRYHDTAGLGSGRNVRARLTGSFSLTF